MAEKTYDSSFQTGQAVDDALTLATTAVQPEDLGTAAGLDVPVSGNAGEDEVVLGSDSRLSDTREPKSHGHEVAVPTGQGQKDGFMSHADKATIDSLGSAAFQDTGDFADVDHLHAVATPSGESEPGSDGFMSADDKALLASAVQPEDLGSAAAADTEDFATSDHGHADAVPSGEGEQGSAGFLSAADKATIDSLGSAAFQDTGDFAADNHVHAAATPSSEGQPGADGFISAADQAKLNGIESGATADQSAQEIATAIDADQTAETTLKSALALNYVANQAQQVLHGFLNRTSTTLAFANNTHVFTLGVATTATVYLNGVAYTLAAPGLTLDLDDKTLANGLWYVWLEVSGATLVLNASQESWLITNTAAVPVATVYWNGSAGAVADERHGHNRNLGLHLYLHKTVGARIANDGSFAQTRPTTVNDGQIELVAGTLWDEDIANEISTAKGKLCRHWYETASNVWTFADGTDNSGYDRPHLWNGDTSRVRFPESDNSYTLADAGANDYVPVWVYASNDIDRPLYVITPALASAYTTLPTARQALAPVVPFAAEIKLLYRWIYRGDGNFIEAADYRTASSLPSGGVSAPVAASVSFAPAGGLAATNVQAALEELDTEKVAISSESTVTALKIAIVAALPESPDSATLYFVTGS